MVDKEGRGTGCCEVREAVSEDQGEGVEVRGEEYMREEDRRK